MHFHWQNLNERPGDSSHGDATGHPLWHGRAWLHLAADVFHVEWLLKNKSFRAKLDLSSDENEVTVSLAVPPASIHLSVSGDHVKPLFRLLRMDYESCKKRDNRDWIFDMEREFGISIHDWTFHWSFWNHDACWNSSDPWWMRFSLNIPDFFLGKQKYSEEVLSKRDVEVPMPEGKYPATAIIKRATWRRQRWPIPLVQTRTDVEVPCGIPVPGKGENSWDCGPDAIYSSCTDAQNAEEAIGRLVASALRTRQRHAGTHNYAERPSDLSEAENPG